VTAVDQIMAEGALNTLFQPIVVENGTRRVYAFECLTRGPAGSNFERADILFEYARLKGIEAMIDRACIARAFATARVLGPVDLALNVHASTLAGDATFPTDLAAAAQAHGFAAERLIIEIVEQAPVLNRSGFLHALDVLRTAGFRIALDDVGHGHSNFAMMLDARPHLLKIDRHFTFGAQHDPLRAAVVDSIASFAVCAGARVVAEGVEDESDRAWLAERGIELMQGYLFARPMTARQAAQFAN
jgi:EAL domain-containing protein (putative c-di-GMP-specific phosphodiesterase class I)